MRPTRPRQGVRGIFPIIAKLAPSSTSYPTDLSQLGGSRLAIDATLLVQRFHFADDPHPSRHLIGFYRFINNLRDHHIFPIMVFDHPNQRLPQKAREQSRRRLTRSIAELRDEIERRRRSRLESLLELVRQFKCLNPLERGECTSLLNLWSSTPSTQPTPLLPTLQTAHNPPGPSGIVADLLRARFHTLLSKSLPKKANSKIVKWGSAIAHHSERFVTQLPRPVGQEDWREVKKVRNPKSPGPDPDSNHPDDPEKRRDEKKEKRGKEEEEEEEEGRREVIGKDDEAMDLDKAKKGVLDKACPAESHEEDDDEWETIPEGEPVIMTQEQFDGPLYDFESRGRSDPTRPKRLPRDPATAGLPKTILILPLPDRTFRFEPGIEKFSSKAEKYITYKIGPRPRLPEGTTPGWSHEQIKKLKRSDKKKYQAHDRYLRKLKRLGLTEMKAPPGTVFKVLKPPPKDRTEILEQLREQRRLMRARRRLRKETKKMRKRERKAMRREKLAAKIAKKEGEGKTPEEIMEMVRQVEREQKEERKKLASAHTTERARLNSGPGWEKMEKALTTKKTRPKGNPNRKELKWGI